MATTSSTNVALIFALGTFLGLSLKELTESHAYARTRRSDEEQANVLTISSPFNFQHLASGAEGLQRLTSESKQLQDTSFATTKLSLRNGLESTIGNTPLIPLASLSAATGCTILAKAEYLNGAGGSPKDRAALSIINDAEQHDQLTPHAGDTIYEGTVGSTGISLAAIARARGYKAHIVMPSDQSPEKYDLLMKLGATVERVPPAPISSPEHYVNLASARAKEHTDDPNRKGRGFFANQFNNAANWRAHFEGTGPEIWTQTNGGKLDAFVAGGGTGGTISGVARYLKVRMGLPVKVVLSDPQGSGLLNRIKYGVMYDPSEAEGTRRRQQVDSLVEGIGCKWVTNNFEAGRTLINDAIRVTDEQAMGMAKYLVEKEGLFLGSSSAVNCKFIWEMLSPMALHYTN